MDKDELKALLSSPYIRKHILKRIFEEDEISDEMTKERFDYRCYVLFRLKRFDELDNLIESYPQYIEQKLKN